MGVNHEVETMNTHVLLISANDLLIHEFEKYGAVTETPLIASTNPTDEQIENAHHVFIDSVAQADVVEHSLITLVVLGETSPDTWQLAVTYRAAHVAVLPEAQTWIVDHFAAPAISRALTVGIIPAIGGAGASTIASALAVHAKVNFRTVMLVDLDRQSAGLDIVCGAEDITGMRWDEIGNVPGKLRGEDILRAVPVHDGVHILSWERDAPNEVQQIPCVDVLQQLAGVTDLLVLDFGASEIFNSELVKQLDAAIVVVPNTIRGCASAARRIAVLQNHAVNCSLVVREISGSHLNANEVSESLQVPLLTRLPTEHRVVEQIEQGMGPGLVNLGGFTKALNSITEGLSRNPLLAAA